VIRLSKKKVKNPNLQLFQVFLLKSEHALMKKAIDQGFYESLSDLARAAIKRELRRLRQRGLR